MLGRLMKYELRYTSRVCVPALLIMLAVTVLGRLFTAVIGSFMTYEGHIGFEAVTFILNIFLMAGAVWIILILMAVRFYRNLTRDEGYLMFTLPVKPSTLIWSKLLTSYIWYIAAGIVVLLAMVISLAGTNLLDELISIYESEPYSSIIGALPEYYETEYGQYTGRFVLLIVLVLISALLSPAMSILMLYASIAAGQLVFPKNRVLGAVLSYFGLNFLMQTVSSLFTVPFTISINSMAASEDIGYIVTNYNLMLVISLLISVLFTVTFYLITNYIFTKRLNLE